MAEQVSQAYRAGKEFFCCQRNIKKNPATTQLIARSEEVVVVVVGLIYVLLSKKFCQSCGMQRLTSLSLQLESLPWPEKCS